ACERTRREAGGCCRVTETLHAKIAGKPAGAECSVTRRAVVSHSRVLVTPARATTVGVSASSVTVSLAPPEASAVAWTVATGGSRYGQWMEALGRCRSPPRLHVRICRPISMTHAGAATVSWFAAFALNR